MKYMIDVDIVNDITVWMMTSARSDGRHSGNELVSFADIVLAEFFTV